MAVDLARLMALDMPVGRQAPTAKDAILYAVSVGYAGQSAVPEDLSPLYETIVRPVATFANVVAVPPGRALAGSGIDFTRMVHAEHRLTLHRAIPLDTMLKRTSRMQSVADRGAGKGIFASFERTIRAPNGEPVATIVHTDACRGDGGCGSAGTPPPPLPRPPERQPDQILDIHVPHLAGILYRLNGDLNPLHIDPARAAAGGFPRPILHGLCTFGYAEYAISQAAMPKDTSTITSIGARFSAPFYPGETLRTELWSEGADLRFRCRSVERDITVLDNGAATRGVLS